MPNTTDLMELLEKLGTYLSNYGGWGVATVLLVLFVAYYIYNGNKTERFIAALNEKHDQNIKTLTDLLEKRNNQLVGLIQKCSGVIANASHALEEANELIRENKKLLESSKKTKEDVDTLLEKTNTIIDIFIKSNK